MCTDPMPLRLKITLHFCCRLCRGGGGSAISRDSKDSHGYVADHVYWQDMGYGNCRVSICIVFALEKAF